jgi:hypothetical protein
MLAIRIFRSVLKTPVHVKIVSFEHYGMIPAYRDGVVSSYSNHYQKGKTVQEHTLKTPMNFEKTMDGFEADKEFFIAVLDVLKERDAEITGKDTRIFIASASRVLTLSLGI